MKFCWIKITWVWVGTEMEIQFCARGLKIKLNETQNYAELRILFIQEKKTRLSLFPQFWVNFLPYALFKLKGRPSDVL